MVYCTVIVTLSACSSNFETMGEKRLLYARSAKGPIHIAAIQDGKNNQYVNGVLLASEEINTRSNRLLGRRLNIDIYQGATTIDANKKVVAKIIANPKITAVLGHRSSKVAVPASVLYERGKVIFLSSFSTAKTLTGHSFKYTFRMAPGTKVIAEQVAGLAKTLGYKKVVTLHSRSDLYREQAFLFEDASIRYGIDIVKRSSFFAGSANHRALIAKFNDDEFDAVFLSAPAKAAGIMAKQLREMGIDQPILGDDSLNNKSYIKLAEEGSINTIIPSLFRPEISQKTQRFVRNYKERFGVEADYNAAQGYDSMMLLAQTIQKAESTVPSLLASTLRYIPAWAGITGVHAFDESGDVRGKKYFFKVRDHEKWVDLPAVHASYFLTKYVEQYPHSTINFKKIFATKLSEDDYRGYLLELAQHMLKFKRLGVILDDSKKSQSITEDPVLKGIMQRKNLTVVPCYISFSSLNKKQKQKELVDCYGRLSLKVDALLVGRYVGIDNQFIRYLNQSLTFFKIPSFSFSHPKEKIGVTAYLTKRSNIERIRSQDMRIFDDILVGGRANELFEKITNLPYLVFNLSQIQQYDLPQSAILSLSPDQYIEVGNQEKGYAKDL